MHLCSQEHGQVTTRVKELDKALHLTDAYLKKVRVFIPIESWT